MSGGYVYETQMNLENVKAADKEFFNGCKETSHKYKSKKTNSDKIRSESDLYISVQIAGCIVSYLIQSEILYGTEADHKDLISGISDDILEWLQQSAED